MAALLLPLYVTFQLLPLPLGVVRLLSPIRGEIADALQVVGAAPTFASLTIAAPTTWVFLWRSLGYVLIFLLAGRIAARSTRPWTATLPLLLFGVVEAAWVISQYAAGDTTRPGSYDSKDHVAGLLEMVLPLAAAYGIALLSRARRAGHLTGGDAVTAGGLLAVSASIFAAITFSMSRAGLLSTVGSMLVMGALASGGGRPGRWRWPLMGAQMLVLAIVVVFVIPADLVQHLGRLASGTDPDSRLPIWKDTLGLIRAFPLFGVGLGNFYPAILRYQTSAFNVAWTAAHNDYLQQLAELGIVGVCLPAIVLGGAFFRAVRAAHSSRDAEVRWFAIGCAGSLSALLIHSVFDFNTYVLANAMVLAWVAGLAASLRRVATPPETGRTAGSAPGVRPLLLGAGALATAGATVWLVFLTAYHDQPSAERVFCRFGFCDTEAVLETLRGPQRDMAPDPVSVDYRAALLRRDPAMPVRWEDLAEALRAAGRTSEAEVAIARAMELDRSPETLLNAAAFWFQLGQRDRGLALMSRALQQGTATDLALAFSDVLYWKVPFDQVLRQGLPDRRAAQAYLRFLIAEDLVADAATAWAWMLPRGELDQTGANEFTALLLRHQKPEAAARAWAEFVQTDATDYPDANRVFNGDFEDDPSGNAFDWRMTPREGVTTAFDATIRRSGARALRMQFDGTQNVGDVGVEQRLYLAPGRYLFRAEVKTDAVSTDQGVAFRLVHDDAPAALNVTTEAVRGTHDWQVVEQVVDAPPNGGLVRLMVVRKPSLRFDNLVRGTAWIDRVSLAPIQ